MTETFLKNLDILIHFTLSKPVFRVFGDYLKCFKWFNNNKGIILQNGEQNIKIEIIKLKELKLKFLTYITRVSPEVLHKPNVHALELLRTVNINSALRLTSPY